MNGGSPLGSWDVAIILVYVVAIIAIGLAVSRRQRTASDYFLAHKSKTWPVIGLALLASNISSTTLIGLAGAAYDHGIAVFDYEWMAGIVLVFFCIFLLPFLLKTGVYTTPEFLERRYDRRSRLLFSGLTLFLNIAVDTAGTLYGGALMFQLAFPAVPMGVIVLLLALGAGIYTTAGGLAAVMVTETIQAVLLLTAAAVIAVMAFSQAGGWDAVMAATKPEMLSLIRPAGDPVLPWTGLVTGVPLIGFYFWCTNQFMVQRVLSAKSIDHGRWGCLFAGLLKLPVLFLMVLPGTAALLLFPGLPRGDLVYPSLVFKLLPAGVVGLVVAGFLAAIMSATASTFNSASTLVTMDFVRLRWPHLGEKRLVTTGRLATLAFMALAVLWAPQIARFGSLWQYLQAILAYAVPPVVALFLVGLFWARANATGAFAAFAGGLALGLGLFVYCVVLGHGGPHFLLMAPLLVLASALILVVVSLATGDGRAGSGESKEGPALVWTPAVFRAETATLAGQPLWMNYRVLSLGLVGLTAILVWWFR
ncbi:sodium:solute symporter [Nitrospirillum amazonense]|uniref:sodium:solute symporter n=1 Tax=Nitrospirillum amazonense TaxID=28077 RepID=UPI002412E347|nr:sodium:solute symporter [Nitrospirillum amazonense]MDG3442595.1 sodium:solute symporter [Nitrospirillum amazonense]